MVKIKIDKKSDEIQLKSFLMRKFPELSSSKISKLIDQNKIRVNQQKSRFDYILKVGDELRIYTTIKPKNVDLDFLGAKQQFKVIYEDENVLIVDKPSGLVCQKDINESINTLNNQLKKYLYLKKEWEPKETDTYTPHLCHRLDKHTRGLIIFGKNEKTVKEINNAIKDKQIRKFYKCLVLGKPKYEKRTLKDYWMENPEKRCCDIDRLNKYNKEMITKYEIEEVYENYSLLDVEILTGRKHQIRLHLSSINNPILGDTKYNKIDNLGYKYPCLVSYKLIFDLPKNSFLNYLNNKKIEIKNIDFPKN